jgi:uncharacterized protein YpmB
MDKNIVWICRFAVLSLLVLGAYMELARPLWAQSQEMRERVAEVKEEAVHNKQLLAQYTWAEQVTISLKGEEKKQEHFQVRLGPDGKPQKQSLDPPAVSNTNSSYLLEITLGHTFARVAFARVVDFFPVAT